MIKISESDYQALVEMCEDFSKKLDEQAAVIKMYESIHKDSDLLNESSDEDLNKILDDLSESIDQLNATTINSRMNSGSFSKGSDTTISIISENIMPILSKVSDAKAYYLESLNRSLIHESIDMTSLDKSIDRLCESNMMDRVVSSMAAKLSNSRMFSKSEVLSALSEATSDMIIYPAENGVGEIPKYEYFDTRVYRVLQSALKDNNKSDIFIVPEDDGNFVKRSELKKFDLPIYRPKEFNATPTVKSAILNLAESLTDIDGNLNIELAKKAYLYKKTSKPTSLKDFAFPIAICEDNKLYAHPELIKTAANILKNDNCMKVYDIDSRETLYQLRESLTPYLEELNVEVPWLALDESKKRKATKKLKCKACGAECDELSKDGLCPACEKAAKKASKKKSKK